MEDEQEPEGDALFGWNVRHLREGRGWTQDTLAQVMRRNGRPWHQSTVPRVESGKQPATFADIEALMGIFGVEYPRFKWRPDEAVAAAKLRAEAERVRTCAHDVARTSRNLLSAIFFAEQTRDASAPIGTPAVDEAIRALNSVLEVYDLETAVGQGEHEFRELHDDEGGSDEGDAQGEPGVVDQR